MIIILWVGGQKGVKNVINKNSHCVDKLKKEHFEVEKL